MKRGRHSPFSHAKITRKMHKEKLKGEQAGGYVSHTLVQTHLDFRGSWGLLQVYVQEDEEQNWGTDITQSIKGQGRHTCKGKTEMHIKKEQRNGGV